MQKILLSIIFLIVVLVNVEAQTMPSNSKKYSDYVSSIRVVKNGFLKINPTVIENNKNLKPFIDQLNSSLLILTPQLKGIPTVVLSFLQQIHEDHFKIAEPNSPWNCCCDRNPKLPNERLLYHAEDRNLFLIVYQTGGIATMTNLVLIRYNEKTITDFWQGYVSENLTNQYSIVKYLSSLKIKQG